MYTAVVVAALLGALVPGGLDTPSWHSDYASARNLGRQEGKPLAVFIGSGKAGWHQLTQEGKLGQDTTRLLAEHYVCVYVDTRQQDGQQLAAKFEVPDGLGLILSDRSGAVQAFRHEGDLPEDRLVTYLTRFADPGRETRTTETNPVEQVRYESPELSPPPPEYRPPVVFYPSFSGGGGRSC
jgi:hypothetical protein